MGPKINVFSCFVLTFLTVSRHFKSVTSHEEETSKTCLSEDPQVRKVIKYCNFVNMSSDFVSFLFRLAAHVHSHVHGLFLKATATLCSH